MKINNRSFSSIIVLIIILVLVFSGCSKNDEKADTAKSDDGITASDTAKADDTTTNTADITVKSAGDDSEGSSADYDTAPGYSTEASEGRGYSEKDKPSYVETEDTSDDCMEADIAGYDYGSSYDLSDDGYSPAETPLPLPESIKEDISATVTEEAPAAYDAEDDTGFVAETDTEEYVEIYRPQSAGLLTAGEWNDNEHFEFLRNLITNGHDADYAAFFTNWELTPFSMFKVLCLSGGSVISSVDANGTPTLETVDSIPVRDALVEVYDSASNLIYTARSNVDGYAYIYYSMTDPQAQPKTVTVSYQDQVQTQEVTDLKPDGTSVCSVIFSETEKTASALDLMFVIDTTGSMGDEIAYLQTELSDVISRVRKNNADLSINLSVNFYRDLEDEYIVRSNPFSSDIDNQLALLNREYASGGGDYEEAVELALIDAVEEHNWSEDSTKLLFIVLDAPPHNTPEIRTKLANVLAEASAKGIRIIPIASSGIDKDTEFLLRTFAMTTGGTYTFLTNDSGIGGGHIEATVGSYVVENLNDLLVRVISNFLSTTKSEPVPYNPSNSRHNPPVYVDDPYIDEPFIDYIIE